MWRNYLKIALRSFFKQKLYSTINVLGLAISLAAVTFIFLYVQDELSYDRFHENGDRIYRLTETFKNGDEYTTTAMTPYRVAELLHEHSPAVASFVRFDTDVGPGEVQIVEYGNKRIEATSMTFADSTLFEVFSFDLLAGNPEKALVEPYTMVIAEEEATAIFGDENPIGKIIKITNGYNGESYNVTVTGVMADMPDNAHFHYNYLMSKATGDEIMSDRTDSWGWTSQYSYVMLAPGHHVSEVEAALDKIVEEHAPQWFGEWASLGTQFMPDIHLHSNIKDEIEANGSMSNVYIFSIIGIFILLIASINYMNLATARAAGRAREVGMRKVIGARYKQLVNQFLAESLVITSLAFIVAIALTNLFLPGFNQLTGKSLALNLLWEPTTLAICSGIMLIIGLLAGSYPAFFLASYQPLKVLKGFLAKSGGQAITLRKGLVVLQFTISIALIIGILVVYSQWDYLRSKRLGINTEQMLMIPVRSQQLLEDYPVFKQEALRHPNIAGVTVSSKSPLTVFSNYATFYVDSEENDYTIPGVGIDEDFFDVYGAELLQGRDFESFEADSNSVILNEAAARMLGMENPIGQELHFSNQYNPTVIGVTRDFNFESLHAAIRPMYFYPTTGDRNIIAVRIAPNNIDASIEHLQNIWSEMGLAEAFSFTFFDEDIDRRYASEAQFLQVFSVLTALAIFIACLGLFGLAAFTAEQRTKEIGIRKVLGEIGRASCRERV